MIVLLIAAIHLLDGRLADGHQGRRGVGRLAPRGPFLAGRLLPEVDAADDLVVLHNGENRDRPTIRSMLLVRSRSVG